MKLPPQAKRVFKGVIFDVYQWDQEMFDGTTEVFEALRRSNGADVIAVVDGKILITHDEQPARNAVVCLPGGRLNTDEDPQVGAARELAEETGYTSDDWELLSEENTYSKIDWTLYTFIARNAKLTQEPHLDAGERIKASLISFDEFVEKVRDKEFRIPQGLRHILWEALFDANKKAELKKKLGL